MLPRSGRTPVSVTRGEARNVTAGTAVNRSGCNDGTRDRRVSGILVKRARCRWLAGWRADRPIGRPAEPATRLAGWLARWLAERLAAAVWRWSLSAPCGCRRTPATPSVEAADHVREQRACSRLVRHVQEETRCYIGRGTRRWYNIWDFRRIRWLWLWAEKVGGRCIGFLHVDVDVASGRLGGGRGIWDVDGSLHGRPRERERRGQGQAVVVHCGVRPQD